MGADLLLGGEPLYFQDLLDPNVAWYVRIEFFYRLDPYFAQHSQLCITVVVWKEGVVALVQKDRVRKPSPITDNPFASPEFV